MEYHNNKELDLDGTEIEKLLVELIGDLRKSITQSLTHLNNN
jgi:hypothetical protein